jgi:hypothetical protein
LNLKCDIRVSRQKFAFKCVNLYRYVKELWSLMHFLMPHVFQSHSEFKNWFSSPLTGQVEGGQGVNMDLVGRLHGRVGTAHRVTLQSKHQFITASMVHVTNLISGSEGHPPARGVASVFAPAAQERGGEEPPGQDGARSALRVGLVTWTIMAVINWCFLPYALLGLSLPGVASDKLHGPYSLSSIECVLTLQHNVVKSGISSDTREWSANPTRGLSKRQRRLYEEYMASSDTSTTLSSGNLLGIINCLMQLRKVCNHPDLFAGRPIVSAYDMLPGVSMRVPSILANDAREREENPFGIGFLAPRGFHLLSLEDVGGGGGRWEGGSAAAAREALRRMSPPEEVEECLAGGGGYARAIAPAGRLGRMTASADAAARLFADARAAAAKMERREVARRIAAAAAAAAARMPMYGADLRRAVDVPHPVHACHAINEAFGAGPFAAAPCLLEAVRPPTRRAVDASDLIATFMFAIPKARAPPPVLTCSAPSASVRASVGLYKLNPVVDP